MNQLFYGDNLEVLRKYLKDETIDLCYIDPPFNSDRNYNQIYNNLGNESAQAQAFVDTWTWDEAGEIGLNEILSNEGNVFTPQSVDLIIGLENVLGKGSLFAYLVSITLRIAEVYRVLKPTGSFYLHCDPTASHYLKLVADSIFCSRRGIFQNEIIWRRTGAHNKAERYAPLHDVILFYVKSEEHTWNKPHIPYMQGHVNEYFKKEGDTYKTGYYGNVLTGSGIRGGESGLPWKGINPTEKGRHWAIPGKLVEEAGEDFSEFSQHQKLDRLFELGFIKFKEGEAWPIYEHLIDPYKDGPAMSDIWSYQPYSQNTVFGRKDCIDEDVRWLSTKDSERLGYPTQKPEGLLERIIQSSTNEGDVILDAYCGCGTTVSVAQKLKRQWIGVDITYHSISLILKRIGDTFGAKELKNITLNGVPQDFDSAIALANKKEDKTRKEFEKWCVLTYSNNRAMINEKKGGDGGIDGTAFIFDIDENRKTVKYKIIFSVKSDKKLSPTVIRDLYGTVTRDHAAMGIFISLYPMDNLKKESKKYGLYEHLLTKTNYPKILVIDANDILSGAHLQLPTHDILKSAKRAIKDSQSTIDM